MEERRGTDDVRTAPGRIPPIRDGTFSALLKDLFARPDTRADASWSRALRPGAVIGRFELVREVGRGGFGVVWEAKDRELGRVVALKALRPGDHPQASEERLLHEAEAAARLSHPNIVAIHDVGRCESGPYLILELLKGKTLAERLEHGAVPLGEALRIGVEIAKGLAHAHAAGVVHRDLTPGNVFLCDDGQVKLLDLGIAHLFGRRNIEGGTPSYMAPEQRSGAPEDERTDVFALGVILYRMLRGELPFAHRGRRSTPRWTRAPRLDVPEEPGLGDLVARMLAESPLERPRDAREVSAALQLFEQELRRSGSPQRRRAYRRARRWRTVIGAAALVAGAVGAWSLRQQSRSRWALAEGLPQVSDLVEQGRYSAAFTVAKKVEAILPAEPRLQKLWPELSRLVTIETVPDGADVYAKDYFAPDSEWRRLGRTPIVSARLPLAHQRIRIQKAGFVTRDVVPVTRFPEPEWSSSSGEVSTLRFTLDAFGTIPDDMVRVPGALVRLELCGLYFIPPVQLSDFLMDRTEVTNKAFKRFVDAGGYRRRDLWKQAFEKDGRTLTWNEAMALFHDRTGRPGPATWESGDYPEGQGDLPVTGVSWYEAAAYAAFVGKDLPTLYQWSWASGQTASAAIIKASNFGEKALAPVGRGGIGPFGTYDMAGNAKEWVANATGDRRYLVGGAWNEPIYTFNYPDAQPPLSREPSYGFRLVKTLDPNGVRPDTNPVPLVGRNYAVEKPVTAEVFDVFERLYAYDRTPLNARVEAIDDSAERWRKEKISFAAAYGDERVTAYLFTPRNFAPPFQTVVFFPDSSAMLQRSSEQLVLMRIVGPIVRSGRAVVYPVYKSTYERADAIRTMGSFPTASYRDHVISWAKDVSRSIDYVETRPDLQAGRVALYGVSWGAKLVPLIAAVEDRIKVGIMVAGGLAPSKAMPEVEPFNFAPHAHQPMLMLNGRYDFLFPVGTNQSPLFERLGSPPAEKRHVLFDAGRMPPNDAVTREALDWLDRHLGPVAAQ